MHTWLTYHQNDDATCRCLEDVENEHLLEGVLMRRWEFC